MTENTSANAKGGTEKQSIARSCQYLGTETDPSICYSFPSAENYCYKIEHPVSIVFDHQDAYCLTSNYAHCKIYEAEGITKHAPKGILRKPKTNPKNKIKARSTLLFIIGIVILGIIFSMAILNFYGLNALNFQGATNFYFGNDSPSTTSNETRTPTFADELDILFLFPRQSQTNQEDNTSAEIQNTPTPTAGPQFGNPIGTNGAFLLHKVASGESLHYLANLYNSSAENISEINCLPEGFPIIVNQILVIKPGATQTGSESCYSVVHIEKETPLENIAATYHSTPEELTSLNDLGEITNIPYGRLLIIPDD